MRPAAPGDFKCASAQDLAVENPAEELPFQLKKGSYQVQRIGEAELLRFLAKRQRQKEPTY